MFVGSFLKQQYEIVSKIQGSIHSDHLPAFKAGKTPAMTFSIFYHYMFNRTS